MGPKTDHRTGTADGADPGSQAYLVFFGALVNGFTSLGE
jgi:hypothetical protein